MYLKVMTMRALPNPSSQELTMWLCSSYNETYVLLDAKDWGAAVCDNVATRQFVQNSRKYCCWNCWPMKSVQPVSDGLKPHSWQVSIAHVILTGLVNYSAWRTFKKYGQFQTLEKRLQRWMDEEYKKGKPTWNNEIVTNQKASELPGMWHHLFHFYWWPLFNFLKRKQTKGSYLLMTFYLRGWKPGLWSP